MYPTKMKRANEAGTGGDDDNERERLGLGDLRLSCVRHISGTLDGVSCAAHTLKQKSGNYFYYVKVKLPSVSLY